MQISSGHQSQYRRFSTLLCIFLFWVPVAEAEKSESEKSESAEIEHLEARVEALEALVRQLMAKAEPASSVELAEAETVSEEVMEVEEPATAESSTTGSAMVEVGASTGLGGFDQMAAYLPSKGWNAAWQRKINRAPTVRAFIDFEFIDAEEEGSRSGVSTFDTHHVQVFLDSQLNKRLSAHAELEWEHSGDTVEVDQAYIAWKPFDNEVSFDFGRFYTPFGIERFVWYSPTNALVSRPDAMREIVPGNFYANGVRASGLHELVPNQYFTWEVAGSNGLGDSAFEQRRSSRQNRDNNSDIALSGRVAWAFWPRLEIGASYHTQTYGTSEDTDLSFLGFDLSGRWRGFELRAEYVEAEIDRASDLGLLRPKEEHGAYAQLSYTLDWDRPWWSSLTLVGRYDDVDLDLDQLDSGDRTSVAIGLNLAVHEHFRLKWEHQWIDETGLELANDRHLFQAVVDF